MRSLFRRIIVQSSRYSYQSTLWPISVISGRGLSRVSQRVLFRFHENAERRVEDKGSFRLTARPQDGPKAPRLPSHNREIFSLHLSPPSATPQTYEDVYILEEQSRFSFRVTTSSLSRPPPLLESLRSHYDIHLTSACCPTAAARFSGSAIAARAKTTARFSTLEI